MLVVEGGSGSGSGSDGDGDGGSGSEGGESIAGWTSAAGLEFESGLAIDGEGGRRMVVVGLGGSSSGPGQSLREPSQEVWVGWEARREVEWSGEIGRAHV